MKKLTPKEKQQLQAVFDRQSMEQDKKRRRYRKYKSSIRASRYSGNAEERLEKLEKKHEKTERTVAKHSELKVIRLTEKEKRELEAKIQETIHNVG